MDQLNIRITHRHEVGGEASERTIDIETIAPRTAQADRTPIMLSPVLESTAPAASARIKVMADGSYCSPGSPGTDHVAVLDQATGLMWTIESLGDPDDEDDGTTQEHCIERCKQLRLLGYDDWRLPTRAELVTLIDDTRRDPAIDVDLFPRVKSRWHWTSTAVAGSSASAWLVGFSYGSVSYLRRHYYGFALAVRRAGQ